jgi:hypothetical protein
VAPERLARGLRAAGIAARDRCCQAAEPGGGRCRKLMQVFLAIPRNNSSLSP